MNNEKLKNHIDKTKSDYNQLSLSVSEKESIRANIFEKINPTPVKSPYLNWQFYVKSTSLAFATLLLITSPVVAGAQKSLPGDFLYPVKINFNESVAEIFAPEKEEYQKSLLTKRAHEIKKLSEEGDLEDDEIEDVELAIEDAVEKVIKSEKTKDKKSKDIIKDHKDVIAVLEFSEKIIDAEKPNERESKIDHLKITTETSLKAHIESIPKTESENPEYLEDLIEEAKEEIERIEKDNSDLDSDVEPVVEEESVSTSTEPQPQASIMMTAKLAEVVPVEIKTEASVNFEQVLDLYEQISDKKVQLEINRLDKEL